ncbi:MAG: serine/threonine protein kinase [Archangium sp.]|nr:serine/threonine protein kinase [Archangium sp.]
MMDTAVSRRSEPAQIPGYELTQLVGKGGMGEVHQATQLSLQRTVAVKLLKAELAKDAQFVGRFEKEGAALASLRHPQIVSIVDRGKAGDAYYLVMEFVDGPSLREKMREADFDATKALITMLMVARAVEYAHGRGVVHRDLKPENILFDEQAGGIPKVTDFGLAGFDESFGPDQRNLTQTHVSMGTASYMAPEQSVDAKSAGPRADIYSLGVMLYEVLTGELPIGAFTPASSKKAGIDKRIDPIIARCLKPSPDDRYPSATALIADLEKVVQLNTSNISLSRETSTQRLFRRAKEIAQRVGRTTAAVIVAFAVAIIATVFLRSSAESKRVASGVELMTDFGAKFPMTTPGRVERKKRLITMGEGPDTVGLMALGRKPEIASGSAGATIDFGEPDDERTGRVVIDADVVGTGVDFTASVDTIDTKPSVLEPLWQLFRGRRPEARSALMLLGDHGRYVALVVAADGREPTLEWALGPDKRGFMQAPLPVKREGQRLSLRMDPETGELFAVSGEGRDARVLGDGLWLGPYWRQLLGDSPRVAVGCLEGRCVFRQIVVQGLDMPNGISPPPFPREDVLAPEIDEEQQDLKTTAPIPKKNPPKIVAQQKPPVKPPPNKPPPNKPPKRK